MNRMNKILPMKHNSNSRKRRPLRAQVIRAFALMLLFCMGGAAHGGSHSAESNITVVDTLSPAFSTQPLAQVATADATVTFDVAATGFQPIDYRWSRNGDYIGPATDNSVLTLQNVQPEQTGIYRVTITNKHGSVTSDELEFKVFPKGTPQIFADGKEVIFADGGKVIDSVVRGDKAEITLSTSFEDGTILYTLDGSEPSFESTPYQASFTVSKTTGIRAIAYKQDFSDLAEADPVFINIVPNYNLNVSIEGQGAVVKDPPDGPYIQDSVVKLKAVPAEGWEFAGWSGALMSSFGEGSVVMGSNKSVTAKFERIPECKIIPEVTGGGEIYGLTPKKIYTLGKVGDPIRNGFQITLRKSNFKKVKDISDNKSFIEIKLSEPNAQFYMLKGGANIKSENLNDKNNKIILSSISNNSLDYYNNVNLHVSAGHALMEQQVVEYCIIQLNVENSIYRYRWHPGFEDLFYQGVEIKLSAKPDEGYKFFGWSGDATGTNSELTLTMDRDKTVEAVFGTELSTIATGKGKLIINPASGPYPYGTKVSITPVPDAGYYLGLWGGAAFGLPKGPIEYEITEANPKFTALFVPLKENRFTITTLASSGGLVISNPNSNAYVNGQQVTLTATPDPGYSFVGWTGDIESTSNPLITLADANKTVTAEFSRNIIAPVTLTINAENGTVTRTPSDELYEKGTSVELLAQANAGYTFTGWAGALQGTASRATLFLDGDKTVTANFKASYQLATETRGPGSVLTTPSSTTFIDGDEVILTASPAEGYGFVGWTGDLESTDQQTTLAMESNKRVIAHFAQLGTLTTWTRGEGTITRSPDKESYFPGASVTLTATAGDGFQFVNWDGQASGTSNPTTVTMDRAMSVAANFKDIQAPTVTIASPASQETGDETFTLSGAVTDNGSIRTLVWLWKGKEMGELELNDGSFELKDQKLVGGPNDITVIATDRSGNEGKATAKPTVDSPKRSIRIAVATEKQEGRRIDCADRDQQQG